MSKPVGHKKLYQKRDRNTIIPETLFAYLTKHIFSVIMGGHRGGNYMNYGKKGTSKKNKLVNSKSRQYGKKAGFIFFKAFLV